MGLDRDSPDADRAPSGAGPGARERRQRLVVLTLLALVLVVGLRLRLEGFSTPLTTLRDTQTASITRNLQRDGFGAMLRPRVHYPGDAPGHLALEFPLVNALAALSSALLPRLGDSAYRLPSLLAYLLEALCLFDLLRRRSDQRAALLGVALLSLYPLHILLSVAALPDETALALAVASLALFDRYLEKRRATTLVAGVAALMAASLARAPNLIVLLPLAGLVLSRGGARALDRRVLVAAGVLLVPLALWSYHSAELNASSLMSDAPGDTAARRVSQYMDQHGRLDRVVDPQWYGALGSRFERSFTLPALLLAPIGLALLVAGPSPLLIPSSLWLLGLVVYALAFPFHLATHPNYSLLLAPWLALLGGVTLSRASRWLNRQLRGSGWALCGGTLLLIGALGLPHARSDLTLSRPRVVQFGEAARQISAPEDLLVVSARWIGPWNGVLLYQADRRGWKYASRERPPPRERPELRMGPSDVITIEKLEEHRRQGADFYGHLGRVDLWERDLPELSRHLATHYEKIDVLPNVFFYDLRRRIR